MKTIPAEIRDLWGDPLLNRKVKTNCCKKFKTRKDVVQIPKDPKRILRDSVFCDDFSTFETVCIGKCD